MDKLLVISGPTATGKTKLGIDLAKKFDGEIISADSRQVYRHMNIGTGKDVPVNSKFQIPNSKQFQIQISNFKFQIGYYEAKQIPLWLLDVVDPDYRFNVADYKRCADLVIKDIWQRGKLPIIVGGTGLYIKAVVDGIETIGVEPDWKLRDELQRCKVSELQRMLEELDSESLGSARDKLRRRMNESDRQNPRRLIRAIEIARNSKFHSSNSKIRNTKFNMLFIGLTAPNKFLYEKIDQRVDERVENGIEEEIRGLLEKGYAWKNSALGVTLSYREWQNYFEGKETKEGVVKKWKFDEHNYSRRQMTWLKRDKRINWYDVSKDNYTQKVEKLVKSWYIEDDD